MPIGPDYDEISVIDFHGCIQGTAIAKSNRTVFGTLLISVGTSQYTVRCSKITGTGPSLDLVLDFFAIHFNKV